MRVLVTGSAGFIGQNLCADLALRPDATLLTYDAQDDPQRLETLAAQADIVFHLAGINRPVDEAAYAGNMDLARRLTALLERAGKAVPLVLASSIQAALDNPYGRSKAAAEQAVFAYARATGAPVYVYRFPNVFGKWCRPHYNSVVATFCHQAARGEPLRVDALDRRLTLLYIDDLLATFMAVLDGRIEADNQNFCDASPTYSVTLGDLADMIRGFAASRGDFTLRGDRTDPFVRKLYATFLSYLPQDGFAVPTIQHEDERGYFAELFRMPAFGQVSVSRTRPGIIRGQHWHHTKAEKFVALQGQGVIRFRRVGDEAVLAYPVSGARVAVVDIPPGYTHHIENTGDEDLILLIWAGELFDPDRPDTHYLEV
ncbi:MAG: NAD-dependent epimerase/dehydratase family protein [Oscillospiraceae bacterium]|jgi:UDP-2-acetamido-2,6-beta-L-arabino-hexul-4-ose reductase|nr:NAD-dependent epimerase/dehydratase family protein [Oscillospiraceae bacterium]